MKHSKIRIVFTDLDRTLLRKDGSISEQNYQALQSLAEENIIRVVVTGRSLFSLRKVVSPDFPVDYLIYSSGTAIMNWKESRLLHGNKLDRVQLSRSVDILISNQTDFMVHAPIPDNHYFHYYRSNERNDDFFRRLELYRKFARKLVLPLNLSVASQLLAVLQSDDIIRFNRIRLELSYLQVIRTTSPLDHSSIWLEIFPRGVSKGHGVEWLCRYLKINPEHTVSVGNDYNDLEMLECTGYAFVVNNAPDELKQRFMTVGDEDHGFARMVGMITG